MDNLENERRGTANAAEAEGEKVAADLGKFKDVKALLDAYNSLEAEFTRRSQRLKELESNKADPPAEAASGAPFSSGTTSASAMPMRIAKTGPPTTSNRLPRSHAGTAMTSANSAPLHSFPKSLTSSMRPPFSIPSVPEETTAGCYN